MVTLAAVPEQARQLTPQEQAQLLRILGRERATRLDTLLDAWLNDQSGYDEEAWPELRAALDQTRSELGMQGLFGDRINPPLAPAALWRAIV